MSNKTTTKPQDEQVLEWLHGKMRIRMAPWKRDLFAVCVPISLKRVFDRCLPTGTRNMAEQRMRNVNKNYENTLDEQVLTKLDAGLADDSAAHPRTNCKEGIKMSFANENIGS